MPPMTSTATTSFRFMQVDPSAGTVSVMLDSSVVNGNVAYLSETGYAMVNAGTRQLLVQPPGGSPAPFINSPVNLSASTKNTFILGGWGTFGTMGLLALDDTSPPTSGIKLRVADVAAQAGPVDIYVLQSPNTPSGTPTFSPSSLPFASSYLVLAAGTYDVFVTTSGTTTVLFHTGPMAFTAGQNRTIVLSNNCLPTSCSFNSFRADTLADLN